MSIKFNNLHKYNNLNLCKYCSFKFLQKEIFRNFDSRASVTLFMKQLKQRIHSKKVMGKICLN